MKAERNLKKKTSVAEIVNSWLSDKDEVKETESGQMEEGVWDLTTGQAGVADTRPVQLLQSLPDAQDGWTLGPLWAVISPAPLFVF